MAGIGLQYVFLLEVVHRLEAYATNRRLEAYATLFCYS